MHCTMGAGIQSAHAPWVVQWGAGYNQPMPHGWIIPCTPLYNPWCMGRLYPSTHCTMHGTWADCTLEPIVQPMPHGWIIPCTPLYNPWCMGRLYLRTHCTMHAPWADCTLEPIVQCMVHGQIVPWNPLYNP